MDLRLRLRTLSAAVLGFGSAFLLCGFAAAETPLADTAKDKEDHSIELRSEPLLVYPLVLIQVQAMPYVGDDAFFQAGDMAEQPGFRLRRARVGIAGELYDVLPFELSADLITDDIGNVRLNEAWVGYRYRDWLEVYAGAHRLPFTRTGLLTSAGTALLDRPLATQALAPFQQVGVHAEGKFLGGALKYSVGVWNGFQRNDLFFSGYRINASPFGNRFDDLAYSIRLSTEPFGDLGRTIADYERTPKPRLGAGVSYFYSDGGSRNIHGGAADALLHWKGIHVLGEFLLTQVDPEDIPSQPITQVARIKSVAAVGEAGYTILKDRLSVNARVEWINANTDVSTENDQVVVNGGVTYFVVEDLLKAQLEYIHRQELGGRSLSNDMLGLGIQLEL